MKFDITALVGLAFLTQCSNVLVSAQGNKPSTAGQGPTTKVGKIKRASTPNNDNNGQRKGVDLGELTDNLDKYDELEIDFPIKPKGPNKTKFIKQNAKNENAPPGLVNQGKVENWYGRSADGAATAQMTKFNGISIGNIIDELSGTLTRLTVDADGNAVSEEIDLTTVGDEEDGEEIDTWDGGRLPPPKVSENHPSGPTAKTGASADARRNLFEPSSFLRGQQQNERREATTTFDDTGATIDLMVVWTSWAECAMSYLPQGCTHTTQTTNNMLARIAAGVEETNTAFYLSGVDLVIRLVHAYRTPNYVEYDDPAKSSECSTALRDIRDTGDGHMEEAHTLREIYGADMVSLLVGDLGCNGVAYRSTPVASKSSQFSVVKYERITGTYTFPHELGHNMGMNHDKGTKDACSTSAINYGYRDPQARFRSILSYDCTSSNQCEPTDVVNTCIRVNRFSNTYSLYPYGGGAGVPIGTDEINNANHIKANKHIIAGYFPTVVCSSASDCNDGNACTTDVCNNDGFCEHTDIAGCCGNGICESGEDTSSCEADCAYEFETTFTGSSTRNANMFDITAKNDVGIYGMEIHVDTISPISVEVWTRPGSWVGNYNSQSGWTQVLSTTVTGQGAKYGTPLPNFSSSISMLAGETRAFYIYSSSQVLESSYGLDNSEGTIVEFNYDMELKQGRDQNSKFGSSYYSDKVWNGVIKYTTDNSPPPPPPPPTPAPPPVPAPTPSGDPALTYRNNGGTGYGLCEGDCDLDSDCLGDLVCYQRSTTGQGPEVPGCSGEYLESRSTDFCYERQSPYDYHLKENDLGETFGPGQYGLCEGDCDNNEDCIGDLICYFRSSDNGGGSVLGCNGEFLADLDDDFCGLPELAGPSPTAAPTSAPSSEPSAAPSFKPSAIHSSEPSSTPSVMSSSAPTSQSSSEPSSTPSAIPSSEPSSTPSVMSSSAPTSRSSSEPSSTPSAITSSEPSSTPSVMSSSAPTSETNAPPELTYIGQTVPQGGFGLCEGDCDDDTDCQGDMLCYQRSSSGFGPTVPGCTGSYVDTGTDFCYQPVNPYAELTYIGNNFGQGKYGLCEGDCDRDSDCQGDLLCYQRSSSGSPGPEVPGCAGAFLEDLGTDFCYQRQGPREYHKTTNNLGAGQYGLCEGDCDRDGDCIGDLICYQRSSSGGGGSVKGCNGKYGFNLSTDFCGEP